ncbi:uncharacterized protein LOC122717442 [Apis laboriosa]|uniref:uncharacterized protein LOC122717442 n=1 Tax=Apis laboriosa TaxID=183418 RepID=UPI001CC6D336|nr:uncharacterized protein LOC122717442 [Apis laboriosa]
MEKSISSCVRRWTERGNNHDQPAIKEVSVVLFRKKSNHGMKFRSSLLNFSMVPRDMASELVGRCSHSRKTLCPELVSCAID